MNIKNKIDLHIHTKLSDGTDMPEELLELVKEAGIGVFSVTDHDTVRSVKLIRGLLKQGAVFLGMTVDRNAGLSVRRGIASGEM